MVDLIRPKDLPPSSEIPADTAIPIDTGIEVVRATPKQIADIGRPISTQAQAIAGTDNTTSMTPLTTAQAMDNRLPGIIGPMLQTYVDQAKAWAESPSQPDPEDPDSQSAKTWAEQAREAAEALADAVGFEQKTFVSVAGQLRYTVDVNGDPLDAMEGFSRLSGSAPFGSLVYGDDYTISDLGYNLTADPGNDRLFFSESFPRTSNTEAMTILQEVGDYTRENAERAEAAAKDAESLFLGARDTPPTMGPDGAALLVGAVYYDTVNQTPYVWDGSEWRPMLGGDGAVASQGAFVVSGGNKTFTIGNFEATIISLNGVTLTPGEDYIQSSPAVTIPSAQDGDVLNYFAILRSVWDGLSEWVPTSWADFQSDAALALPDGAVRQFNGVEFVRSRADNLAGLPTGAGWRPCGKVEVMHYGAIGDGTADDTPAFDAACESGFSEITVSGLESQSYKVSNFVVARSNILFRGVGNPTLKGVVRSDANPIILNIVSSENVTFEGITFDGFSSSVMPFNNVTQVYQSTNVTFARCQFKECKGIAALASGGDLVRYLECSFENCGIYHLTSGVSGDRRQAIAFTASTNRPEVHGCDFENVGLDCASFATGCTEIRATMNRVKTNYAGTFYISQVTGGLVSSNIVENGPDGGNAFDIIDSSNLTVADNIANNCGASGILIAGNCKDILVIGNHLYNNVRSASTLHRGGITFALPAGKHIERISLVGNKCYDDNPAGSITQRYAIGIQDAGGAASRVIINQSNDLRGYNSSGVPDITSVFQTQKLGMTGYPTAFNLSADAEMALYTADGLLGEFGITEVNTTKFGMFFARENQTPVKLLDPDSYFQTTDSGTGVGVYRSDATNSILMRNRTGSTRTYLVQPNNLMRK